MNLISSLRFLTESSIYLSADLLNMYTIWRVKIIFAYDFAYAQQCECQYANFAGMNMFYFGLFMDFLKYTIKYILSKFALKITYSEFVFITIQNRIENICLNSYCISATRAFVYF